ncbi:hypothetical protein MZO44_15660, partial [Lactiplantibacillus sp. E932]|nr:hypothetical protein [Lactiplantibacillus sp. E932]
RLFYLLEPTDVGFPPTLLLYRGLWGVWMSVQTAGPGRSPSSIKAAAAGTTLAVEALFPISGF